MYYKTDWHKAKERMQAFWHNEVVDRCCCAVLAPRKTATVRPCLELQWGAWTYGMELIADGDHEAIRKWWTDPECVYRRMMLWFDNTYFGGEAIPAVDINWGAMAMAGFYGSPPVFTKETVWYPPVIEDWGTWEWKFDRSSSETWNQTLAVTRYLVEQSGGRYFVGSPQLGSAGDLLSLMRGAQKLCMDLVEYADEVRRGIEVLADTWVQLHEEFYNMTLATNDNGGVLAWMMLWAPGRHDQLACDLSTMISPAMFKEFFVPEIEREAGWCEYGTYHLDGPEAMRAHLTALLEIPGIHNIEWTPGVGCPPTLSPQYIPMYKKIQAKGKRLYLLAQPNEVEGLLAELSPRGLYLCTWAESEEEADALLRNVAKWSARRGMIASP